ncbi:MAG: metal ABC transporter substrate-binding protein [Oscillospiraceae bacterium]
MRKILCVLLSAVLAVSALSGCAVQRNPDADDGKLHVVTTIFAPYDFARQVGGDDVSVTMLLRPGCEVHAYEPTPKDIIAIRNADVFIYVGGESDAWVKTVLDGVDNPEPARRDAHGLRGAAARGNRRGNADGTARPRP